MVELKKRHAAILTAGNAHNPRTWSGTPYYMARALETHVGRVTAVGCLEPRFLRFMKGYARLKSYATGQKSLPGQSRLLAKYYAKRALPRLEAARPDFVFAPAGSTLLADLKTDIPVVYTSDTTARLMVDYYPQFKCLGANALQQVDDLERSAVARADLLLYPTNWAAQSAIDDYGADPSRVWVLPYGANFEEIPSREAVLRPRNRETCKLLFVGVNWAVKGGQIALDAFHNLVQSGTSTELTIVGCTPPVDVHDSRVTIIPFLDKNDPEQRARLSDLYLDADFLVLPTRSECYGIVFCEASAHGVPSVASATGGVPEVVRNDVNGYILPYQSCGNDYAELIRVIHADKARHESLRQSSRDEYERRLNWNIWGRSVAETLDEFFSSASISNVKVG